MMYSWNEVVYRLHAIIIQIYRRRMIASWLSYHVTCSYLYLSKVCIRHYKLATYDSTTSEIGNLSSAELGIKLGDCLFRIFGMKTCRWQRRGYSRFFSAVLRSQMGIFCFCFPVPSCFPCSPDCIAVFISNKYETSALPRLLVRKGRRMRFPLAAKDWEITKLPWHGRTVYHDGCVFPCTHDKPPSQGSLLRDRSLRFGRRLLEWRLCYETWMQFPADCFREIFLQSIGDDVKIQSVAETSLSLRRVSR